MDLDEEIDKFDNISDWWCYNGNYSELHRINHVRVKYILDKIKEKFSDNKIKLLDIGCGGGIATMALARKSIEVLGVDLSKNAIISATNFAKQKNIKAQFEYRSIESLVKAGRKYDVILCLEMLEHTDNPQDIIDNISKLLNKDGLVFLSTINKTMKSKLYAIYLAERLLNLLPINTHNYDNFITPDNLSFMLDAANLRVDKLKGIKLNMLYNQWMLSDDISVNYILSCTMQKNIKAI